MTLPASGTIGLRAIGTELGRVSDANVALNETAVRTLVGKASGTISLKDGYGKSNSAMASSLNFTNNNIDDIRYLTTNIELIASIDGTVTLAVNSTIIETQRWLPVGRTALPDEYEGYFYINIIDGSSDYIVNGAPLWWTGLFNTLVLGKRVNFTDDINFSSGRIQVAFRKTGVSSITLQSNMINFYIGTT